MINLKLNSGDYFRKAELNVESWFEQAAEDKVFAMVDALINYTPQARKELLREIGHFFSTNNADVRAVFNQQFLLRDTLLSLNGEIEMGAVLRWLSRKYPERYMREIQGYNFSTEAIEHALSVVTTPGSLKHYTDTQPNLHLFWVTMEDDGLRTNLKQTGLVLNDEYAYRTHHQVELLMHIEAEDMQAKLNENQKQTDIMHL